MPSSPQVAVPLKEGRALAGRALNRLERSEAALRLAVAGGVRRMEPWTERVDLLATAHEPGPLLDALAEAPFVAEVLERTPTALLARSRDGVHVRLEVAEEACFGAALLRATGPEGYVRSLRARARSRHLRFEGDRLLEGSEERGGAEEAEVFAALGLAWQPPERRGRGPLEEGTPPDLLEMRDVRGIAGLHPGRYALAELAARAEREGYAWALLPGRLPAARAPGEAGAESPGLVPLVPLPVREVRLRRDDLALVPGEEAPPDGVLTLAYPAAGDPARDLAAEEWVARVAALPDVDVVVLHALGVLDVERVVAACATSGVALGVEPPPFHPEPEPDLLEEAARRGVPLLLTARAHDLVSVDDLILGVGLARRAAVPRSLVLNALDAKGLVAWAERRRGRWGGRP